MLCERINRVWGERIRWTSARELAVYAAAREATRFEWSDDDGRRLRATAPFACPAFTVTIPVPPDTTTLSLDSASLDPVPADQAVLREGQWRRDGDAATVCLPLRDQVELVWR